MDQILRIFEDPMDALTAYEREETDRVIALSLQEEEQKVFEQNEWGDFALFKEDGEHDQAQSEEDEEFAMALHESLDTESPTGYEDEFTYWSYPSHMSSGQRFQLNKSEDDIIAQLEDNCESSRMQWMEDEEERFQLSESKDDIIAQLEDNCESSRMQWMDEEEERFQLSEIEDDIIAQLEKDCESSRMQWMEDEEERFQLSEIEDDIIAQLEKCESSRMQEERFQLNEIQKVIAQLEKCESSRMQEERFHLSEIQKVIAQLEKCKSRRMQEERFQLSEIQKVIAQLEKCESRRMQEERFQLSEIQKVIAQLEEDQKRRKVKLMEDEELAMASIVESFAEIGKGDISQPDASSVSPGQEFVLYECQNVSISELEDVERHRSSQIMEDEQLAITLQESLKVESPDQLKRICTGCNSFGHGKFLNRMDDNWHPECFRCHKCNLQIVDEEFSEDRNKPYHRTCYEEHFRPKCEVCKNQIPPETEYRYHPFWKRRYCPSHEDGTPRCCSCERLEPKDMKYLSLVDGRKLCIECSDSAIMDRIECQPLYREIQEFFEDLDMKIEQDIPFDLVGQQALNEKKKGREKGCHDLPETRGLTVFEGNEVTVIFVLNGLPRLLLGNILAHEMMHSWLRLKGYRDLSPLVEEGMCQVMAYRWLRFEIDKNTTCNSIASSSASPSFQHKLADCFRNQIETDDSPIYGKGFKLANQAVVNHGLEDTLYHIQMTGSFPS